MIKELEEAGIEYKEYNDGKQINAKDLEGVTHCFYPTTGTVVLHASNDWRDHRTITFKGQTLNSFIKGMKFRGLTKAYFKGDK